MCEMSECVETRRKRIHYADLIFLKMDTDPPERAVVAIFVCVCVLGVRGT